MAQNEPPPDVAQTEISRIASTGAVSAAGSGAVSATGTGAVSETSGATAAGVSDVATTATVSSVDRVSSAIGAIRPAGIDNTLWTAGINPTVIGTILKPIKTIVVGQDPPVGTQVPFGTAVSLSLASIDSIPLTGLKNSAGLNFTTIGDLHNALSTNPGLLNSINNATSFQALSATDQQAFTAFATQHGSTDAAGAFSAAKTVASL
jgi:hypothetical protein